MIGSSAGCSSLGWRVVSQRLWNICPGPSSLQSPLKSQVPLWQAVFLWLGLSPCYPFLILECSVLIVCHKEFLFWPCLFGGLCASCIFIGKSFLSLGKFSSVILLKIWSMALTWDSFSLLLITFVLSWCSKIPAYSFHFKDIIFLRWLVQFFYFIFKSWHSAFYLTHLLVRLNFQWWKFHFYLHFSWHFLQYFYL